ncbi:hypothetical protein GCM10009682_43530 [Luedemannella flava]|uniref:Exo-alpha-sialidase n=1 Tax=Luedemannella flava TaxID=349316 RepID=A0ABP4YI28_9ACTN
MADVEEATAKELRRAGGRPRWDLARVLAAVTRRQRRRSAIGGVLALAALAGVTVVGVELFGGDADEHTAEPAPTATLAPAEAELEAQVARLSYVPADAVFADARRGYALVVSCADRDEPETCTTQLAATVDGGATWQRRPLPAGAAAGLSIVRTRLLAVGPNGLLIDQPGQYEETETGAPAPSPTAPPKWIAGQRWFSPDGGRTWAPRARRATGTVTGFAPGYPLFFPSPDVPNGLDPASPRVAALFNTPAQVVRADGSTAVLARGPRGEGYTDVSVATAADGSVWVPSYVYGANGGLTVRLQVTRDRGRTFQGVRVPTMSSPPSVFTADGRNVYLLEYDGQGGARLRASANAGRTWRDVKLPAPPKSQRGPVTTGTIGIVSSGAAGPGPTVAPAADGALLVTHGSTLYRLAPGAAAMRKVADAPVMFSLMPAGRAMVGFGTKGGAAGFFTSPDGVTWRTAALS